MHPAFSVIIFTTASGAGYGILALLGTLGAAHALPGDSWLGLAALALALVLVSTGLLSSTFHLGHPERAWRAVSQWRSSWLSREGVAALFTYVPAGIFGLTLLVFVRPTAIATVAGAVMAGMALVTVCCTAMIYASLKPIHQWYNAWVLPNYVALALYSGALCFNLLMRLWNQADAVVPLAALAFGSVAVVLKWRYWWFIDTTAAASTPATATGLINRGTIRLLAAPHTEQNYLLREMGFRVARKHAAILRSLALASLFAMPLLFTAISMAMPQHLLSATAAVAAVLSAGVGVLVERWLFFAEAKHTVTLYYGAPVV